MKIDTLHYIFPEEAHSFDIHQIMENILNQKNNFIKRFSYEPNNISLPRNLVNYLENNRNVFLKIPYSKTFDMNIIIRSDDVVEYIKDNEVVCIK